MGYIYINGMLDASAFVTTADQSYTDSPFFFGPDNRQPGDYNDFTLDDVAFYNKPLSAEQVASHWAAAPEPSTFVLLGIGAVSLLGYAWWRRKRVS